MNVVTAIRVVLIVFGVASAVFNVGWLIMLELARRKHGVAWQVEVMVLARGVVKLIVSAIIICAGAGFHVRPLAYFGAAAIAASILLGVYLRRRYPELLDVDD